MNILWYCKFWTSVFANTHCMNILWYCKFWTSVFTNTNLGMSICKYTTFRVNYRCPFTVFLNFVKLFLPMKFMADFLLPMKFMAGHVSTSTNFSLLWLNCSTFRLLLEYCTMPNERVGLLGLGMFPADRLLALKSIVIVVSICSSVNTFSFSLWIII